MKPRLPLALAGVMMLTVAIPCTTTIATADDLNNSVTHTEDKAYTNSLYIWGNSNIILTVGVDDGSSNPTVSIPMLVISVNCGMDLKSGKVVLGSDAYAGVGNCSLWIGADDGGIISKSTVNISGGTLEAEGRIIFSRWMNQGVLNISGGTVKTAGLYSDVANNKTFGNQGIVNLTGGSLILGSDGISALRSASDEIPSIYTLNLRNGTLGSYASWSSTRSLVITLDSANADEAAGALSDGAGNLDINAARDTTITLDSKIVGGGTGNLTKKGEGELVILAGSEDNTFTQNFVLAGGTLTIDKDSALGASSVADTKKTIQVKSDGSSEKIIFSLSGSNNTTSLNFQVEEGSTLTFAKKGTDQLTLKGEFRGTGSYEFEGSVLFDRGGSFNGDQFLLSGAAQATVSGTLTVKKKKASASDPVPDGLVIGGVVDNLWSVSRVLVTSGGILEVTDSMVALSRGREAGRLEISEGGTAKVYGIRDTGAWGRVTVSGGTLELGKGGIQFFDQSGITDGDSGKNGENYLSDVYFSSGKIVVNEDSAYTYTGSKEFEGGLSGRPASVYTGNFFFGKDNTGALDDPESRRIIEVGEGATFSLSEIILGNGGFNKTGTGIVFLSVANGYKGNTVVEGGSLHLGDDMALGTTGKLILMSGTTLAAQGKSVSIANNVDLKAEDSGEYNVTFGKSGKTDSLTLNGETRLLSTGTAAFNTLSDVTFGGNVASSAETLTKTGAGILSFTQGLSGVQTVNINTGGLILGGTTLSEIKTLNMAANTTLDLGGQTGAADKNISIAGSTALKGFGSYAGAIALKETTSRLNVTGNFQAGKISFKLGKDNASYDGAVKTLVTTGGTAAITGTEKASITLNFDQDYINTFLSQGGTFQLFSTGLSYQKGTILNNQRKLIMVDESQLGTTGTLTWNRIILSSDLISQDMSNGMNTYVPSGSQSYLGSQGGTVVVGENVVYDLEDNISYNLTPGLGTLVYRGLLGGSDNELSIMGYGEIKDDTQPGTGSVVITNNGNNYGGGTIVTGGRLTVDLLQGADPETLAASAEGGNLNVTALSTGRVDAVSGIKGGSEIILQAYGDQTLAGVETFTYANAFSLSGGSVLKQAGANAQILTGDITSGAGANTIANAGSKTLTLKGNITQEGGESLTLRSETASGKIVLDGGKTLTATQLNITGAGEIRTANGYALAVKGLTLTNGTLNIAGGGTLTVGQNGVTGTGTLVLNGGTIKSASSWSTDIVLTLGTGENTISTGGANVHLNKGVTGEGGFIKQGSGHLYVYDNPAGNAKGQIDVKQGRLVLQGAWQDKTRTAADPATEYKLAGDLTLSSGKGASLQGKINANGHNITFGEGTHYYLEVAGESGVTGYIHDADALTIGTGTQLHVDVLNDTWTTENTYTIFSAREDIQGANNLQLALNEEYAFVDVSLDLSDNKEIGLNLTRKGETPGGLTNDGTNKGTIHAVVAPLVAGVLDNSTELTGKLHKHMQTISKMTTTEYQTYLTDMGNSASSYYTALSAQVQDATQHINSVRNRVELLNPVLYDDWTEGGIYNVWAGGISHYRDVKSGSEAPGYEMTSWGGELGCAIPLSQTFMVGVGFAYTFADVQVKDGWGSNDNDTYNVDVFARYRKDALTITGVLTGGFTNTEFHRNQLLKDEYTRSNSSTDGNQFMGTIEAGYDFYLNEEKSWILQPLVNLTAGRAKLDSLSETGELKNAGLMIGSQSYNMFSAGIGAKLAYQYKTDISDQPGRVELKAMYVNDMGDVDFKVNGRFIGAPGNGFDLNGVSNERSAAIVSAGWIAPISAFGQFFVDAGCEFRKNQNGVNTTAGFSFQF